MFCFSSLPANDQRRLRRIHHTTSAEVALKILRSQSIWSNDPDEFANFSLNQDPDDRLDVDREVSLGFCFSGPIELISATNPPAVLVPDVLYVYVSGWPYVPTLEGMRVWAARLKPGSSKHLVCNHVALVREYEERGQTCPHIQMAQQEIRDLVAKMPVIKVPVKSNRPQIIHNTRAVDCSSADPSKTWWSITQEQVQTALVRLRKLFRKG